MDPPEAADWMAGIRGQAERDRVVLITGVERMGKSRNASPPAGGRVSWSRTTRDARPWLAMRVEQWKRVAPVVGLGIQGTTLAGVLYGLVAWRGVHPAAIALIFAGIVALAFLAAWFYYAVMGMRAAEQEARFTMDLRDQDMLSPKEARLLALAVRAARGEPEALEALEVAATCGRL